MKKLLSSICFLVLNVCAFAQTTSLNDDHNERKFYVQPGTVYVGPNGIFVNIEGSFVSVQSISIDEHGVYALRYEEMFDVVCNECGLEYNLFERSSVCPHKKYGSK